MSDDLGEIVQRGRGSRRGKASVKAPRGGKASVGSDAPTSTRGRGRGRARGRGASSAAKSSVAKSRMLESEAGAEELKEISPGKSSRGRGRGSVASASKASVTTGKRRGRPPKVVQPIIEETSDHKSSVSNQNSNSLILKIGNFKIINSRQLT